MEGEGRRGRSGLALSRWHPCGDGSRIARAVTTAAAAAAAAAAARCSFNWRDYRGALGHVGTLHACTPVCCDT
jgi:hypothetical protein